MDTAPTPIAIVDDDADTVAMLVAFFTELGLVATPCPVGPDAPAWVLRHRPQLIILDVVLAGGLSGVDILAQVRADPAWRPVPVIFFSGSEHALRQRLPTDPDQDIRFVEKPDILQLSDVVQRLVQRSATAPA
jgi:CheY-like chemotaxis protein